MQRASIAVLPRLAATSLLLLCLVLALRAATLPPMFAGCAATRGTFLTHALTPSAPAHPAAEHPATGSGLGRALHEAQQSKAACKQNPDEPLSQAITSCLEWQQQQVGCALLEAQGYFAGGVQSLLPDALSGTFSVPDTCGSTEVSLALKQQQQLEFDAGGRLVLAVIAKGRGSSAFFFGRGAGKVWLSLLSKHQVVAAGQQQPSLNLGLGATGRGSGSIHSVKCASTNLQLLSLTAAACATLAAWRRASSVYASSPRRLSCA